MNPTNPSMHYRLSRALAVGVVLASASTALAIDPTLVDDFQDATVMNWGPDFAMNTFVEPDAGPNGAGDFAMRVSSDGDPFDGRVGSRSVAYNQTQWTGDWTAAGLTAISFDASNPSNQPVELWIGIVGPLGVGAGGSGDVYVSLASAALPANTGWSNFTIPVTALDFELGTNHSFGTLDNALAGVTQVRILNNIEGRIDPDTPNNFIGDETEVDWLVDNIAAVSGTVPEPASLGLLLAGGLLMVQRRR